ncbi:uncharacterized protein LOC114853720 isoform X2 [Betta splendens]|uniref:Uncharacterized protein LOC114853720 isoform X2 n=1 Tax=Betta splendens TaxID=158456 RepID=A0A6P7M8C8_BETSP|nr:uncharacterized protein LOC114853720 isoform X2 [Betta splendens]
MGMVLASWLLGVAMLSGQVLASEEGNITLWILPSTVLTGDTVVLFCQYQTRSYNRTTTFFKGTQEIGTYSSLGPESVTNRTIENVTKQDEGTYTCASQDGTLRSPEVRLSVKLDPGNITADGTPASSSGYWKWVLMSCTVVLLSVVPLTVWLVCRHRHQALGTRSCWPTFKQEAPAPATRQDVTEVQWELSWMEMSSLMDKHLYPGT